MGEKKSLGLDIGSSSIKLVELKRENDVISITNILTRDLVNKDSKLTSITCETLLQVLAELFLDIDFKNSPLAFISSAQTVFVRMLNVPAVSKEKMKQVVKYEIQQEIPFSLEEVAWDYSVVDPGDLANNSEVREAVVVAVKKGWLKNDVDVIEEVGFMPLVVDTAPLALFNLVAMQKPSLPDEMHAILDIGALHSNLILYSSNELWVRSINIAGDHFTRSLKDKYNLTYSEAEILKKGDFKGGPSIEEVRECLASGFDSLVSEINISIQYFLKERPLKHLILAGGGAKVGGIKSYLESHLGVDVEAIDSFSNIIDKTDGKIKEHSMDAGVAIGLAMRNLGKTPIEVNLMEGHLERKRELKHKRILRIASVVLLFAIIMSSIGLFRINLTNKRLMLLKVESLISECKEVAPKTTKYIQELDRTIEKLDYLKSLSRNNHIGLDALKYIRKSMARDLVIDSFVLNFDKNKKDFIQITLKGNGASYQSVNTFVSVLRLDETFSLVKPISSVLIHDSEIGRDYIVFVIRIEIGTIV